jgi:hypothetical protein
MNQNSLSSIISGNSREVVNGRAQKSVGINLSMMVKFDGVDIICVIWKQHEKIMNALPVPKDVCSQQKVTNLPLAKWPPLERATAPTTTARIQ